LIGAGHLLSPLTRDRLDARGHLISHLMTTAPTRVHQATETRLSDNVLHETQN